MKILTKTIHFGVQFLSYAPHGILIIVLFLFDKTTFYKYSIDKALLDYHAQIIMFGLPIALITSSRKYGKVGYWVYLIGCVVGFIGLFFWFLFEKNTSDNLIYFGVAGVSAASYFRAYLTANKIENHKFLYELISLVFFAIFIVILLDNKINVIFSYFVYLVIGVLYSVYLWINSRLIDGNKNNYDLTGIAKHAGSNWISSVAFVLPFKCLSEYAMKFNELSETHQQIAVFLIALPLLLMPLNALTQYIIINANMLRSKNILNFSKKIIIVLELVMLLLSVATQNTVLSLICVGLPIIYYKLQYLQMQISGDELGMMLYPILSILIIGGIECTDLNYLTFRFLTVLPYFFGAVLMGLIKRKYEKSKNNSKS